MGEGMSDGPVHAFVDLPLSAYPMVYEFFRRDGQVVHRIEVSGPGVAHIPGLAHLHGPIGVRITYGDGTVSEDGPP